VLLAQDGHAEEALVALGRAEKLLEPVLAADAANTNTRSHVAEYNEGFGYAHAALASNRLLARDSRMRHWREAKGRFAEAYAFWQELRDTGGSAGVNLVKPEALALEIAKCDVALR